VSDADGGVPGLADRLNHLFSTVPRHDGKGYFTNEQAAAALTAAGTQVSDAYIGQLRNGKRNNPSARHLAAIAELFAVPVDYFFKPEVTAAIDNDLRLLSAIRDSGVKGLALRAQGLSPETISGLASIIEQVRKIQQIPDGDAAEDAGGDPGRNHDSAGPADPAPAPG
jgi:transcriptional regulator with XRE-family HTH domain